MRWKRPAALAASQGTLGEVAVRVKAGTPADTDFDIARDGFIVVDTTRATMWLRAGGTWHDVAGSTPKVCIATRTSDADHRHRRRGPPIEFNATDISDPFGFHDPASNIDPLHGADRLGWHVSAGRAVRDYAAAAARSSGSSDGR